MSSRNFDFVRAENIRNFQRRLKTESDPAKRDMLSRLLAEELAGTLTPDGPGDDPKAESPPASKASARRGPTGSRRAGA